jgi:hypothetical protein
MPSGYARGTTLGILGHNWNNMPFVSKNFPSDTMGVTEAQRMMSAQDNILPPAAWNIITKAGGPMSVTGDYLYRDLASFGNQNGLWGLLRVEGEPVTGLGPAELAGQQGIDYQPGLAPIEAPVEEAPVEEEEAQNDRLRGLFNLFGQN